jgi:hypothetical protein
MWGFKHDQTDPHDTVPIRTVKVLLRMHIPILRPIISRKVHEGFERVLTKGRKHDGNCQQCFIRRNSYSYGWQIELPSLCSIYRSP